MKKKNSSCQHNAVVHYFMGKWLVIYTDETAENITLQKYIQLKASDASTHSS